MYVLGYTHADAHVTRYIQYLHTSQWSAGDLACIHAIHQLTAFYWLNHPQLLLPVLHWKYVCSETHPACQLLCWTLFTLKPNTSLQTTAYKPNCQSPTVFSKADRKHVGLLTRVNNTNSQAACSLQSQYQSVGQTKQHDLSVLRIQHQQWS